MKGALVLEEHVHAAIPLLEALHRLSQRQLHAVPAQLAVKKGRHIWVKGVHQLLGPLHDGHIHAQLPQVFRQLQTDEPAPRQHGGPGPVLPDKFLHAEGVLHRPQGEQLLQPDAGQSWLRGLRPGGENQLVIAFLEFLAGLQILDGDSFALRVESRDLVADPHLHPEAGEEALRRLKGQGLRVGDRTANVIGQAAVGIGNVPGPLKHDDLRLFVQTAEPGRRRGASRHTAYNDNLHVRSSFTAWREFGPWAGRPRPDG